MIVVNLKLINGTPVVAGGLGWIDGMLQVAVTGPENPVLRKSIPIYEFRTNGRFFRFLESHRDIWDSGRCDAKRVAEAH